MPARYEQWGEDLKRIQDLLGEQHDLYAPSAKVAGITGPELIAAQASWSWATLFWRGARIEAYRQMTSGQDNLWHKWRVQASPQGKQLEAAGLARDPAGNLVRMDGQSPINRAGYRRLLGKIVRCTAKRCGARF